jgi:hypothetical protein
MAQVPAGFATPPPTHPQYPALGVGAPPLPGGTGYLLSNHQLSKLLIRIY